MKARLSDQADIIANGQAPMPMYTCLHVKSNVSAKVFQARINIMDPKYDVYGWSGTGIIRDCIVNNWRVCCFLMRSGNIVTWHIVWS